MSPNTNQPPSSGFEPRPGYPMSFKAANKNIRVSFADTIIVDTDRAMVMHEDGHAPVYYFAREDINMQLLTPTSHLSH